MEGYFANAHRQHRDRHEQRRNHHHRYSSHSDESRGGGSTHIRRTKSQESESSVNYLAQQLQQTGSFDYNQNRASYQPNGDDRRHHIFEDDKENDEDSFVGHVYSPNQPSISKNNKNKNRANRASMEHAYMNAMKQMNRGDYGPAIRKTKSQDYEKKAEKKKPRDRRHTAPPVNNRRITSIGTQTAKDDDLSTTAAVPINVTKRSVSKKAPSEEIIAIFGAYGITGQYFLQQSIEAGYNVKALILPGMDMGDIASYRSLRLITGSLGEEDKIREVVRDATYVVCLVNDCDHENVNPPVGIAADDTHMAHFDFNNLNFMHNLVPILEDSKTCRVLLYEVSPFFGLRNKYFIIHLLAPWCNVIILQ